MSQSSFLRNAYLHRRENILTRKFLLYGSEGVAGPSSDSVVAHSLSVVLVVKFPVK